MMERLRTMLCRGIGGKASVVRSAALHRFRVQVFPWESVRVPARGPATQPTKWSVLSAVIIRKLHCHLYGFWPWYSETSRTFAPSVFRNSHKALALYDTSTSNMSTCVCE